jgi:hypothetical protein
MGLMLICLLSAPDALLLGLLGVGVFTSPLAASADLKLRRTR